MDADLKNADLRGAFFGGAVLRGTQMSGADIAGADLRGALGLTAEQVCSTKAGRARNSMRTSWRKRKAFADHKR